MYQQIENFQFFNLEEYKVQIPIAVSNYLICNLQKNNENCQEDQEEELIGKLLTIKNEQDYSQLILKLNNMQRLIEKPHPHIIKLLGFCSFQNCHDYNIKQINNTQIFIVMEKCQYNLDQYIQNQKKRGQFTVTEVKKFFTQTLSALEYMQRDLNISHRDIKPENILIDKDENYKIADLDSIKFGENNKSQQKQLFFGTLQFASPEILKAYYNQLTEICYNEFKADVYSFGLTLLYFCTFEKFTEDERRNGIKSKEGKQLFEKKIKDLRKKIKINYTDFGQIISKFIKMMLEKDQFQRPDFIQVYKRAIEKKIMTDEYTNIKNMNQKAIKNPSQLQKNLSIDYQNNAFYQTTNRQQQPNRQQIFFMNNNSLSQIKPQSRTYSNLMENTSSDKLEKHDKTITLSQLQRKDQKDNIQINYQEKDEDEESKYDNNLQQKLLDQSNLESNIGVEESQENQQIDEQQQKKKKKIYIYIIIFMTIISLCLGLSYFLIFNQNISSSNEKNDSQKDEALHQKIESCRKNNKLYYSEDCVKKCPLSFYADFQESMCNKCHFSCQECSDSGQDKCFSCQKNLLLIIVDAFEQIGYCEKDCPQQFGVNKLANQCFKCPNKCLECSLIQNVQTCQKCEIGYELKLNKCV